MGETITVRVNEAEINALNTVAKIYNCGISSLLKRLAFEQIENEYDISVIKDYEERAAKGKTKNYIYDKAWKMVGL